jgi:hypothetical protein
VQVAHADCVGKRLIQEELREVMRNLWPGPENSRKNFAVYRWPSEPTNAEAHHTPLKTRHLRKVLSERPC